MFKELWIRGTQNEKRTLSEEPIREILRSITSDSREYTENFEKQPQKQTQTKKEKMSLLSMLSQNRLLQQNQQQMPQFQVYFTLQ